MARIDIDLTTFVATGPAETYSKYTAEKREPGTVQVLIGSKIFVGEAHRYGFEKIGDGFQLVPLTNDSD